MLMTPCGNPLICDCRFPPGEVTPGRLVTKSSAARLVFGSFTIWFALIVEEMTVDWVWTISDLDETRTCSSRPPTSSTARTAGRRTSRDHDIVGDECLETLKGDGHRVGADGQAGNEYAPSALLTADCVTPVALCLICDFRAGDDAAGGVNDDARDRRCGGGALAEGRTGQRQG